MFVHLPSVDTVVCHRQAPLKFITVVDKVVFFYTQLANLEEEVGPHLTSYAQDFNLSMFTASSSADFRRILKSLLTIFKTEADKIRLNQTFESSMSYAQHEQYLKSVAVIEIIGHMLICPAKIRYFKLDHCNISISINRTVASPWALRVLHRIDIQNNNDQFNFVFGIYSPSKRDFL